LPDCCTASAPAILLKLEPSRLLAAWWLGLHLLLGATAWLLGPAIAAGALPVLLLHAWRRRPQSTGLIVLTGRRFGLPAEGRFDLEPAAGTRAGAWCLALVFPDQPRARLVVVRDQLTAADWRQLQLAIGGPG
jgi:hypothetical protein